MTAEIQTTPIDRHFARFITRLTPDEADDSAAQHLLYQSALLTSNAVGNGHICFDLNSVCGRDITVDGTLLSFPALCDMMSMLATSTVVGMPGASTPLILDPQGRLYLYRYWLYEQQLADAILTRVADRIALPDDTGFQGQVNDLFGKPAAGETDWQQIAAVAALQSRFTVISGGPGTGKTSTVIKILALLRQQSSGSLRIALTAPTGKAAARLNDSITRMRDSLGCSEEVKRTIPTGVTTLHRLLGTIPDSSRFRYNECNPLPHDLVIVDEASMVPLPLMAKLAIALKPEARLLLLGDKDQLSSVEAGAVLADLCGNRRHGFFSQSFVGRYHAIFGTTLPAFSEPAADQPLADAVIVLKKNYRFAEGSGIGALATAINSGDGELALQVIADNVSTGLSWHELNSPEQRSQQLAPQILTGYRPYLHADSAAEAIMQFDRFRLLCGTKSGTTGVDWLNRLAEEVLATEGLIDPKERWYHGRPIMITVNDYQLELFNGDVGLVWADPEHDGQLRVFFAAEGGGMRSFSPFRLPRHETVYAMTVHKSQGSEFEQVALLLPDHDTPLISRELLYTAVTRARCSVALFTGRELFCTAVKRVVQRHSGLMERLWQTR